MFTFKLQGLPAYCSQSINSLPSVVFWARLDSANLVYFHWLEAHNLFLLASNGDTTHSLVLHAGMTLTWVAGGRNGKGRDKKRARNEGNVPHAHRAPFPHAVSLSLHFLARAT